MYLCIYFSGSQGKTNDGIASSDSEQTPVNDKLKKLAKNNRAEVESSLDRDIKRVNMEINDYLQKKMQKKNDEPLDSLSCFFKSMESLVRTLSVRRQLEVKGKISAMIFAVEADNIKKRQGPAPNSISPANISISQCSSVRFLNNYNNCNVTCQNPCYSSFCNFYSCTSRPPLQNPSPLAAVSAQSAQRNKEIPQQDKTK